MKAKTKLPDTHPPCSLTASLHPTTRQEVAEEQGHGCEERALPSAGPAVKTAAHAQSTAQVAPAGQAQRRSR